MAPNWIYAQHPRVRVECWADRDQNWWTSLNDPVLSGLIEAAYAQNLTLRAAGMRILQARAQLELAAGNLFPQLQQGFGGYTRIAESRNIANRGIGRSRFYSDWILGGQLAWELDFWGRFRRTVTAAEARLDARIEGYDDVLVLLIADVAATYIDIRTFEQRLIYARNNLSIQEESVRLAQLKVDAGARESELDLPQAQANLAETQSLIPDLELLRQQSMNRLSVLLGIPPADLTDLLGQAAIPAAPPQLVLGVPADLLRQRPDVRRAERELAAQSEEIGIAVADLYPHFAINGTVYINSQQFGNLFSSGSWGGSVGPSFRWDVLNYGRLRANIRLQEARFNELLYDYQQTVLTANEEAENAIAAFLFSHQKANALQVGADVSQNAVRIGSRRYQDGVSNFNRLSNLQTELARQQDQLAIARGAIAQGWVNVYRSMGGGWQIRLAAPQPYMPGISQGLSAPQAEEISAPEPVPPEGNEDNPGELENTAAPEPSAEQLAVASPPAKQKAPRLNLSAVKRFFVREKKQTSPAPVVAEDAPALSSEILQQPRSVEVIAEAGLTSNIRPIGIFSVSGANTHERRVDSLVNRNARSRAFIEGARQSSAESPSQLHSPPLRPYAMHVNYGLGQFQSRSFGDVQTTAAADADRPSNPRPGEPIRTATQTSTISIIQVR